MLVFHFILHLFSKLENSKLKIKIQLVYKDIDIGRIGIWYNKNTKIKGRKKKTKIITNLNMTPIDRFNSSRAFICLNHCRYNSN